FDDVDAAFQMHLNKVNYMQTRALAMNSCEFEFIGKAAHAAAFPENGINALDALILTFNGISALRQQLTSDVRIHGIITDGGTAANVIPEHCKANFYVRAARKATFLDAFEKVKNCARGAATMTGCELKINMYENQFDDLQENPVLAEVLEKYLVEAGVGPFPKDEPSPGSTDVGNVSYRCPTLYSEIGVAGGKIAVHEEDFLPVANGPEAKENILKVVEGFACTAIELSQNPDLVKEARKVFEESVSVG
ncbi:peptidase dimerization domain-containing protein, partial [Ruminococcaceae bacterium OttesenSCG-928-D13]|nr:peptidase dimerization domain-containing protein [Ruminococcaceae bacterium OttesenSCG-928-D13]